ncbi:MAG: hypothetical protein OEV64_12990 [Desulfobulbaceae bacterium]|nr:hypothetical protein [Desulfobulbaceae bacterium]
MRTSLGLSLVTGRPFKIYNIRGRRKKPGLLRRHLTAVLAAQEIGRAHVAGADTGSDNLFFTPGSVKSGNYHLAIGTAENCTLVFQSIGQVRQYLNTGAVVGPHLADQLLIPSCFGREG